MKKIFTYIFASIILCACTVDGLDYTDLDGLVKLDLKTINADTKATAAGEDTYNENLISDIHYYIYTTGETSIFNKVQTVSTSSHALISLNMDQSDFATVFDGLEEPATIFVVANTGTSLGTDQKTIDEIKAAAFSSITPGAVQSSIVMSGQGTLTKAEGDVNEAEGSVSLKRAISKFSLKFNVASSFTTENEGVETVWTPDYENLIATVCGIEKNGIVDGITTLSSTADVETKYTNGEYTVATTTDNIALTLNQPLYSCRRNWTASDATRPVINVVLPWKCPKAEGEGFDSKNTYYKIILSGNSFDANTWYDIAVTLDGLGSFSPATYKEIDYELSVANWKTAVEGDSTTDGYMTDAEIEEVRVLSVERNEYIMYNTTELVIPFVSTHACKAIEADDYEIYTDNETWRTIGNPFSISLDNTTKTITIQHDLKNEQVKPYDYTPYTIILTIEHADNEHVNQTITIVQVPSLSVTSEENPNRTNVYIDGFQFSGTAETVKNSSYEYMYHYDNGDDRILYTVKVSTLDGVILSIDDEKIDVVLGDPRSRHNEMNTTPYVIGTGSNGIKNEKAPHIDGDPNDKVQLEYYYGVASNMSNVLAPEFILSSSWCSHGPHSVDFAKRKCATYQEAGYPAGRWRLPTQAELVYTAKLQADGYIMKIYGRNSYVCGDGFAYTVSNGEVKTSTSETVSFRCVYDSWYWDNSNSPRIPENQRETFMWGDEHIY